MNNVLATFLMLSFGLIVFAENPPAEEKKQEVEQESITPEQRSNKELMELEKQIATTTAKITAKNNSVLDLIRQNQIETNPEKLAEIQKLLQLEHKELNSLIREQSTQMGVLQYRYPERGLTLQRKYKRFNAKSLEEMEKSIGLEGHLKRSREKINKVYGVDISKKKDAEGRSQNSKTDKESILAPTTISK